MKVFVTGGAGFIGCNCAKHFIEAGHDVIIYDNLSRAGAEINLKWLKSFGDFEFVKADIRDADALDNYFKENNDIDVVFHFAGQTAVTTSIVNPKEDFEINATGTLNLLEAIRLSDNDPAIIFSSTNKVYGNLEHLDLQKNELGYELVDYKKGVSEDFPVDFHSPYGCSKGVADQYMRDYNRIYNMKTVVFRQSCIYGPRQMGMEDQGWIAWFIISALRGNPITIYGDGYQVRDVLYIDDLIEAFVMAVKNIEAVKGNIYNIGGGEKNQLSLLHLIEIMKIQLELKVNYHFDSFRPGDQKVYVSDLSKCAKDFNWMPTTSMIEGVEKLYHWCSAELPASV